MKTLIPPIVTAVCVAGLLVSATAQQPDQNESDQTVLLGDEDSSAQIEIQIPTEEQDTTNTSAQNDNESSETRPATAETSVRPAGRTPVQDTTSYSGPIQPEFTPPEEANGTNSNEIRLNFRNAPLEMVLSYLSDAAGFIIVLDTQVRGNVTVMSSHPVTRNEAVDLLNSVLNKNGYAAIRSGRTLTIVDKNSAKTRDIPVKISNDPARIPKNDEMVTQIIPIRFVEARQLMTDLSPFVSSQATIVANEAGNSIVVTDTQANIRHLVEIIKAIDSSAEGETEIRVFHLERANPTDVANVLSQIFPNNSTGNGQNQTPIRFGGRGGRGVTGGGPAAFFARLAANTDNNAQNARIQRQTQVIAVADLRTSSVVVTAAKDLMDQIEGMIRELDVSSTRDQGVYVFHMDNADPQQAAQVLQNMFQSTTSTRSGTTSSSQNSALMQRQQNNASSGSSSVNAGSSSSFGGSGQRNPGGGQLF